jgi:hypothetical protein
MTVRAVFLTICMAAISGSSFAGGQDPTATQTPRPRAAAQPRSPSTPAAPAAVPQPPAPAAPPAPVAPPGPPAPPAPPREGQALNVKVDLTITDQRGGNPVFKKTVTVVTADGMAGFIRSTARYRDLGDVPLNVDAQPRLLADGKIRVSVNLQYDLPGSTETADGRVTGAIGPLTKTSIHENLSLVLENGKSIVAAQSADPVGDRQVLIEVKATILR